MNVKAEKLPLPQFTAEQIHHVGDAVHHAEELVSNHYKMSTSQWLRLRYDIKTLADLTDGEIVHGPFAQVIRYGAHPEEAPSGAIGFDFYKICLQDHAILNTLTARPQLDLIPFCLYIVSHELIHIVRFCLFLQIFDASPEEKMAEEVRVHEKTHDILSRITMGGMADVLRFFNKWCESCDPVESLG